MPPRPDMHWLRIHWRSCFVSGEVNEVPGLGVMTKSSRKLGGIFGDRLVGNGREFDGGVGFSAGN